MTDREKRQVAGCNNQTYSIDPHLLNETTSVRNLGLESKQFFFLLEDNWQLFWWLIDHFSHALSKLFSNLCVYFPFCWVIISDILSVFTSGFTSKLNVELIWNNSRLVCLTAPDCCFIALVFSRRRPHCCGCLWPLKLFAVTKYWLHSH